MSRLVVSLLLIAGLVAACGGSDPGEAAGGAEVDPGNFDTSVPVVDLYEQPVADAPDPADRAGAAADYIDCKYGISQGGWSMDFGPPGSATDPEEALLLFVSSGLFSLPAQDYVAEGRDQDRMLYTYSVAGVPKVAVIVADRADVELDAEDGWVVETFASCDPAEYDPSTDDQLFVDVWLDAEGNRAPTSIITSFRGPEHCGWESVTFLVFEDRQYFSDPRGVLADFGFVVPYDDDAELSGDATNTGYHLDGRRLWVSSNEAVAYLVDEHRVEAWPTTIDPVGCA
jgi:hypothetical protein